MNPTLGDVHVNLPLTNISIAMMQSADGFVASKVFPNIPVEKMGDLYWSYDRGSFNHDYLSARAPGTESEGSGYEVNHDNAYVCRTYARHHDIPDQIRANADAAINSDRDATNLRFIPACAGDT